MVISFLSSLRGHEVFMVELGGLIQYIRDGKGEHDEQPHIVIPLLGIFNNESGERSHLMLVVEEKASGFKSRVWVEKMMYILLVEGRTI